MKLMWVVGARSKFMKLAPLVKAINAHSTTGGCLQHVLVHMEQHNDEEMFTAFSRALGFLRRM